MIILYIGLIALIIWTIVHRVNEPYVTDAISLLIAAATASIAVMVITLASPTYNTVPFSTQNLTSLKTEITTSGNFFLGTGSIDSKPVYFYYRLNTDGTYQLHNKNVKYAAIRESTDTPHIDVYSPKLWFSILISPSESKYVFNIPPGSIIHSYNPNP
jgi:hypothetical protein